jgi:predicted AAA+ superfamily ATPase
VPDLLAAIKAELNRDRWPGRFVPAGSARHDAVPELADYLTGRVELLRLWPFAMAELKPNATSFVDRLFSGEPATRRTTGRSRDDVVADVLRGGYPIAVGLPEPARGRRFANLATLVVERVADDVNAIWAGPRLAAAARPPGKPLRRGSRPHHRHAGPAHRRSRIAVAPVDELWTS